MWPAAATLGPICRYHSTMALATMTTAVSSQTLYRSRRLCRRSGNRSRPTRRTGANASRSTSAALGKAPFVGYRARSAPETLSSRYATKMSSHARRLRASSFRCRAHSPAKTRPISWYPVNATFITAGGVSHAVQVAITPRTTARLPYIAHIATRPNTEPPTLVLTAHRPSRSRHEHKMAGIGRARAGDPVVRGLLGEEGDPVAVRVEQEELPASGPVLARFAGRCQ